jgi:pSer/pThr/pTyr-binding forkhead associated (FHA) protein
LFIGLAGGAAGGAIGGLLLEPLSQLAGSPEFGRLAAMCCIGAITGAATGIIENVTRTGWLKVTAGPIAGKQFILYRNPTYIGSAPDCQIFLFRDPKVGRRHAAIHLAKGRIEIEDLPLGAPTYINREPVDRQKLRNGDEIAIGSTMFLFQEKTREKSPA